MVAPNVAPASELMFTLVVVGGVVVVGAAVMVEWARMAGRRREGAE